MATIPLGTKCTDSEARYKVGWLMHWTRYYAVLRRDDGGTWHIPKDRLVRWNPYKHEYFASRIRPSWQTNKQQYIPTPQEIEEAKNKINSQWSEVIRRQRIVGELNKSPKIRFFQRFETRDGTVVEEGEQ